MSEALPYRIGSTEPGLEVEFERNGIPVDVSGASSITATMRNRKDKSAVFSGRAMAPLTGESDVATLDFQSGDFSEEGFYEIIYEIVWSSGRIEKTPKSTDIRVLPVFVTT